MANITDLQNKYTLNGSVDNTPQGKTIIEHQTAYIKRLQDFIDAVDAANKKDCFQNDPNITNINNPNSNNLKPECSADQTKIRNAKQALDSVSITFSNNFGKQTNATSRYNEIMQNNEKIQKLRNELDLKLKDLNGTADSRFKNYEDNYNYELFMNITWSILATSIIYYVFVKL